MKFLRRGIEGLDARTGIPSSLRAGLDAPVPGAPLPSRSIWAVVLALLALEAATGIALALFYAPSVTTAWASVFYVEQHVPLGTVLRSVHRLGISALVIVLTMHLLQLALSGGYRPPREIGWWAAIVLLLLVLGFAITGNPLPWDQRGFWASRVEAGIMGGLPLVGPTVRRFFQGGNEYGNTTLTRFYALHAIVLPAVVIAVVWLRARAARHVPVEEGRPGRRADQLALDVLAGAVAMGVMFFAAWRWPAPLDAPADGASAYLARPEWYFLPLNQLVGFFPGALAPIGSVVLPGLAIGLLAALPFLDRGGSLKKRVPALAAGAAVGLAVIALLALGLTRDSRNPDIRKARLEAARHAERAQLLASAGVPPEGATLMMQSDPLSVGERVFKNRCAGCHLVGGDGTEDPNGPDLAGYLSEAWLTAVIHHPEDPRFFGTTKITGMDDYADEPPALVASTVALLRGLREHPGVGVDDLPAGLKPGLAAWEELTCDSCHELEPDVEGAAPNLSGYGSDPWLMDFIQQPDAELYYGDQNEMAKFARKLTPAELAGVIAFLRALEPLPVAQVGRIPTSVATEPAP